MQFALGVSQTIGRLLSTATNLVVILLSINSFAVIANVNDLAATTPD